MSRLIAPVSPSGRRLGAALLLAALTLAAYLPSLRNGFVWDDDSSLTGNPFVREAGGRALRDLWLSTRSPDYWPVTSTLYWLEWHLWGARPLPYHAANLALHAAEALLLWRILRRLGVPGAWLAALLFAVHPLNVETVAWIAQLKTLLAMLFYLASVWFFLRCFWDSAAISVDRWYWLSLGSFVLALLSKGSVATLPLVLLGIVAWKRKAGGGDLLRLAPFLAVAALLAGVNVWFQGHQLVGADFAGQPGWLERLLGAGGLIWFYWGKALWPVRLAFVYPQWRIDAADPRWWLPLLAAVAVTAALMRVGRLVPKPPGALGTTRPTMARSLLFAWLYFCVALIPVMGFARVYYMRYSLVADHYAHLALIGAVALAAAAWARWKDRLRARALPYVCAASVAAALAVLTWRQCRAYRNAETLYRSAIARNPGVYLAQYNLGLLLATAGRTDEAVARFESAVRADPSRPEAENDLGVLLAETGKVPEAIAHYRKALALDPAYAEAHNNLANQLALMPGASALAIAEYEKALRLKPDYAEAHNNLGIEYARTGRRDEAIAQFEAALRIDPSQQSTRRNLERLEAAGRQ